MRLSEIAVPATRVRGVGAATAKTLSALGITTVSELLRWWPRDWEDRTVRSTLSEAPARPRASVLITVVAHEWFGYGKMKTLKLIVRDDEGSIAELVCFNRPFLERQYPVDSRASVYGSFKHSYGSLQSASFEIDEPDEGQGRVLPVYPLTAGLSQTQLRKIISNAIDEYLRGIDSELPHEILNRYSIPGKADVVRMMHRPATLAEGIRAREALIFEELYLFEYAIGTRAIARRGRLPLWKTPVGDNAVSPAGSDGVHPAGAEETPSAGGMSRAPTRGKSGDHTRDAPDESANGTPNARRPTPLQARLLERLSFTLTPDQLTVLEEINGDLRSTLPMARLLQGDVGSGKTLIAFLASLAVVENGGQVALLAPTELLARQHAENAARILEPIGVRLAFLTGNVKAAGRAILLDKLRAGEIDVVIGTHALFSSRVAYKRLDLAIIDEQHRFGVMQRAAIQEKGVDESRTPPHLLMMSATPIPRTLALSVFGDLDVSVIRTMPEGRKPVVTHLARRGNESRVYEYVRRELSSGRQAYFVYPVIDQADDDSLKSACEMADRLGATVFPEYPCALIHSKVEEAQQRSIMEAFREGSIRVLVATSVVEVGVDVANATVMVIEHAERFGLSALHQLRGRVGRGPLQSYCFLVYSGNLTEDAKARLKVMHETIRDGDILEKARDAAFTFLTAELEGSPR
jgi:ATP-dependent DNA helicase RecG